MQPVSAQETTTPFNTRRTPIAIRRMVLDDLPQVVNIDRISFSLPWPENSFRFELLENAVSRQWVAETAEVGEPAKIIGMVVVWLILDEAHIATIAVDPQYRGCGAGQQLILTALQACAAEGALSATLEVRERNVVAIAMYHKLGFEVVGRRKRYYKSAECRDTNEDAILMTLDSRGMQSLTHPAASSV